MTLFDQVTAFYGNGCVRLALGDVLSFLEAEFADAEREYQHADVDTDKEEDIKRVRRGHQRREEFE